MKTILASSHSLVGSLCLEMSKLGSRSANILVELIYCRDLKLISRLNSELVEIRARELEILNTAYAIRDNINKNKSNSNNFQIRYHLN